MQQAPFPKNEMDRIIELADFNVDYLNLNDTFKDLAKLAAKVTGSPISMINLIDNYTTWTVSSFGIETQQTPREESICQYTILEKDGYVANDLTQNPIFKDEAFVIGAPHFRFYHGVPLSANEHNLGALCVLDVKPKELSAEKVELLKIISDEITNRLKTLKYIDVLRNRVKDVQQTQNKVVHDIRGPIAGIIGIADIISQQGKDNDLNEVLEFISMIYKGGKSVLELADEILTEAKNAETKPASGQELIKNLKQRFEQLYTPQARSKNIEFKVTIVPTQEDVRLPMPKLMQIAGNLISNAIKFTPKFGDVTTSMEIIVRSEKEKALKIVVEDTGAGISQQEITRLLADNTQSIDGTDGEKGYGFGLALVKHLVKGLHGTFNITSQVNSGSQFEVVIPCVE